MKGETECETSALGPNSALRPSRLNLRITQNPADPASLLDHLVGAGEQHGRNLNVERLGGLEIDHQLTLGRRLHRQVGRLLALENAVDVAGRPSKWINRIRAVGNEANECRSRTGLLTSVLFQRAGLDGHL